MQGVLDKGKNIMQETELVGIIAAAQKAKYYELQPMEHLLLMPKFSRKMPEEFIKNVS
ncbi:hypothetical protein ACP3T3_01430 [Chryseobacterium sp. CBSDS_008]|uniref:hypothetical protein n=1 Tax=Chryseobacterium sp. CBSDS_008 TaxID=3415265 RepID=UPI003CECF234